MIPGKKCRHLNREAVDIGGGEGKVRSIYLTIHQFLRHNHQALVIADIRARTVPEKWQS
jgi:hypothetical protein